MRRRLLVIAALAGTLVCAAAARSAATLDIFTIAGGDGHGFTGDGGPATSASLNGPEGLAVAQDGTIFVADTINQRIRRIDRAGRITTYAGNGKRGFAGDGGPATKASFEDPTAVALGPDGSLYVADTGNNRIRVVRPDGAIATVAGSADQGFSGDGGPATSAQLNAPAGVAVGRLGFVYFADTGNNRVRGFGSDGTITTVAGTGTAGFGGDGGPAATAELSAPQGLAVDRFGGLLIADTGYKRVRHVDIDGTITTVAGDGAGGSGGDGGRATAAQLNQPVAVARLSNGAFFVAEQGGDRVRMVDPSGRISRVAGSGGPRYGGDGKPAAASLVNAPQGLAVTPSDELLIADTDNNRVRYLGIPGQASRLAFAPLAQSVTAPLVKQTVKVKKRKRRVLVVRDVAIPVTVSRACTLTVRLATKKGHPVARLRFHVLAGTAKLHLPARLRSGKHRLTKDHYVLGVTATSGSASATGGLALIVK